jgi:hypothetical protein
MGSSKLPGQLDPIHRPLPPIDRGTNCRAASPRPGVIGDDGTQALDLEHKIALALGMVPSHLPEALAIEVKGLLSPANIAIMAGVLAAWGVAHLFVAGEVADAGVLLVGAYFLGWQMGDVARHLLEFVKGCASARNHRDLDRAAEHMAEAIIIGGVAILSFLLLRKGYKANQSRVALLADEVPPPGVKLARVGRWMSREEYDAMNVRPRFVQESRLGGQTNVLYPADPAFYKAAPSGTLYVEFDVPESSLVNKSLGQKTIPGPNSVHARLAASKGQSPPQMPRAYNVKIVQIKP